LISFPEYGYVNYTVAKGETVKSIAEKFNTSDYRIRYKNELSSYFGEIQEGKKIVIPTPYANKVILYVDKKSFMPISIKIYDEEGIFEAYDSYNVVINSSFASDEFSKNFKGYHF
jgi:LysM repeat protein